MVEAMTGLLTGSPVSLWSHQVTKLQTRRPFGQTVEVTKTLQGLLLVGMQVQQLCARSLASQW